MRMMPPYILQPELMIAVSGVFEILGGIGVLVKRTRRIAGLGLIALLVAVFPANIHLALHPEIFPGMPAWGGWVRLPFQALFMFWVWKTTLAPEASA